MNTTSISNRKFSGTVLFCDDDEATRLLNKRMLNGLGFILMLAAMEKMESAILKNQNKN